MRVESEDGTTAKTRILNDEGKQIRCVHSITLFANADSDMWSATLEIDMLPADIEVADDEVHASFSSRIVEEFKALPLSARIDLAEELQSLLDKPF